VDLEELAHRLFFLFRFYFMLAVVIVGVKLRFEYG